MWKQRILRIIGSSGMLLAAGISHSEQRNWTRFPTKENIVEAIAQSDSGYRRCIQENGGARVLLREKKESLIDYELVDLNGDNLPEVIASANPGPCGFYNRVVTSWILGWSGESLRLIGGPFLATMSKIGPAKNGTSNGYKNLETSSFSGVGTYFTREVYKFDGTRYFPTDCFHQECNPPGKCGPMRRVRCPKR